MRILSLQQNTESVRNGDDTNLGEDPSLASKISTLANQIKEQSKENKPVFDRKLLDFDYGEEEEEKPMSEAAHHHHHHHHHHQTTHPPEPPKVEDVQKIAASVLNPSMLESIQKALAAQGMGQVRLKALPNIQFIHSADLPIMPSCHHLTLVENSNGSTQFSPDRF